jgi:hypothetical protein
MLNAADLPETILSSIIDYADPVVADKMANGRMNTADDQLRENIAKAIRRGHPQMRTGPMQPSRICLVGSGPSLAETEDELRQLLWEGATLVTLNGAYHWCRERNLRPQTQIVMDARACNARFVQPYVPRCNYVLASQCDPAVWDAVDGYPDVWIFHPVVKGKESETAALLDTFYNGNWIGIGGGTTVASRAIYLLRTSGYVRFDLFGIDCCFLGDQHHAIAQPENDHDATHRSTVTLSVKDSPDSAQFTVTPWHVKQFEDFLTILNVNGKHFTLNVHGSGLLARAMQMLGHADVESLRLTEGER